MAVSKEVIQNGYPLPVFNYKVTVGADVMSFSEVSGLSLDYEHVVYKHGLSYLMGPNIIRTPHGVVNITLKRGIVAKRNALFAWLEDGSKKTIAIDLCDEAGKAVVRWKVDKAMVLKMTAPPFTATTNDVAIESFELVAPSLTVEYI